MQENNNDLETGADSNQQNISSYKNQLKSLRKKRDVANVVRGIGIVMGVFAGAELTRQFRNAALAPQQQGFPEQQNAIYPQHRDEISASDSWFLIAALGPCLVSATTVYITHLNNKIYDIKTDNGLDRDVPKGLVKKVDDIHRLLGARKKNNNGLCSNIFSCGKNKHDDITTVSQIDDIHSTVSKLASQMGIRNDDHTSADIESGQEGLPNTEKFFQERLRRRLTPKDRSPSI